jgi:hypothetical protein
MTGKDLLSHFLNKYKKEYEISLAFTTVVEAEVAIRRDAIAATIYRLWILDRITLIDYQKLLKLLHSPDQENWTIVELIIETIT